MVYLLRCDLVYRYGSCVWFTWLRIYFGYLTGSISSGTGRAENSITYRNNINDNWKYGFTCKQLVKMSLYQQDSTKRIQILLR
ncbi:hypothetical protein O9929_05735 [Vibrio lentus]|nr:hypothetical protein [Vibrio lentus]